VKEVLDATGIAGLHASPKGLRHGLGVNAVGQGVPLNLVQRWFGHGRW
jgi:integrase/recombinase XerD